MKSSMVKNVDKSFFTPREVAGILHISIGTAQLWSENGMLRAWKTPGGHRRVTRESVEKLLRTKSETVPATSLTAIDTIRRLRVLVVEDDESLLLLYQTNMSRWPMTPDVTVANNGIDALLMVERMNPDLLVVDLMIPGIDGFMMLQILRANPRYAEMTMAVVSGLDHAEIIRRGGVPDGVVVLPKPVPFAELLDMANRIEMRRRAVVGQSTP